MTKTSNDTRALVAELVTLLRLTRTEAHTARVRTAQAQREETRQELADNARDADARAHQLQEALRSLGGTPDVLSGAIGRLSAFAKAGAEQAQPLSEGLLGDLALEHQLRDRAAFARVLAESQDQPAVVDLLRRVEQAHTETIAWITLRLAEVAQGGPVVLAPTPVQAVVGRVAALSALPSRGYAAAVNRAVDTVQRRRRRTRAQLDRLGDRARETATAAGEVAVAGRDAALARAEEVAPSAGVRETARQTRKDVGSIEAEALPIQGYDDLSAPAAIEQASGLEDAADARVVLAYERAHKDRTSVRRALETRLSELAEASLGG